MKPSKLIIMFLAACSAFFMKVDYANAQRSAIVNMSVNETTWNFGNVAVGQRASHTFVISNLSSSTSALTVSWNSLGPDFSVSPSGSINPGSSLTVTVTFHPTTVSGFVQTWGITNNSTNVSNPYNIILNGNGISNAPQSCSAPVTYGTPPHTYNTVKIGTQCWFKENVNVGAMITGTATQTNNNTIEKYCYANNTANCNTYGGLYQWAEAMQYSTSAGAQGICPSGWHIPTKAELQILATSVSNSGNALKAVGQGSGIGAGTNSSGFSALLSGSIAISQSSFNGSGLGLTTSYWSSTQGSATQAFNFQMSHNSSGIFGNGNSTSDRVNGFSVRCLKN